ncbi:MAG: hypothetical protein EA343_20765, partial [Nodularia sp. (in: Bacteria)]
TDLDHSERLCVLGTRVVPLTTLLLDELCLQSNFITEILREEETVAWVGLILLLRCFTAIQ